MCDQLLRQIVKELNRLIESHGLEALLENRSAVPFLARPRVQEIFACLNRWRGLRF